MFPPSGRLGCIGRLGDRPFLGGFNNPRQADREGRAVAGLALDRDIAAHHLTKASADGEPKSSAAVFARCGFRRAADYVDKILRGTKPGNIPVR
jgi:hypothetical protein